MAERWVPGMIEVSEQMYLMIAVAVDAPLADSQPNVLTLTVSLRSPQGAYGMPSQAELAELDAIQAELVRLSGPRSHVFARLSGAGRRQFFVHVPEDTEWIDHAVAALRRSFPSRTFDVEVRADPSHAIFQRLARQAEEGYEDLRVIQELAKAGADLEQPREIDYTLIFPTREEAEAIRRLFDPPAWRVQVADQPIVEGWPVVVSQVEVVRADRVAHYSAMFRSVAAETGGKYDGWGAPV
jgi:hypothetical protein